MKKIFKKLITNLVILLFVVVVVLVIHILLNCKYPESNFIQRSGGITTLIGVLMVFRKKISVGFEGTVQGEYIIDGGDATNDSDEMNKEARKNVRSEWVGTIVIVLGAIIASYGDLIF